MIKQTLSTVVIVLLLLVHLHPDDHVEAAVVVGGAPALAPTVSSSSSSSSSSSPVASGPAGLVSSPSSKTVTFVFGDSLAEVGNNNHLPYSLARCNYPWYGVDYEGGKPTGRFTNGRTIGDIISDKLGIQRPPPYLSLSSTDDALLKGVNYASGGAGILPETGLYFIQRMTFDDQIQGFRNTTRFINAKLGEEETSKLLNEALYFIGLGSNDYVNNFLQPFMPDGQQYTHDQFLGLLMSTLEKQFTKLYQYGARKIIFNGLGPIGCIPSQRTKAKKGNCLERVNQWAQQFNSQAQNLVIKLNKRLPDAKLVYADTYSDFLSLLTHPQSYGFKLSNTSCCNVDTSIGGLCLPNSKLCKNRRDYVFWDAFHPSDAANVILAEKLYTTLFH